MTIEEINKLAEKSKREYDALTVLMSEIYEQIETEKQKEFYDNDKSYFLGEFHIIVQLLLMGLANIDPKIDDNEITLLRFLAHQQFSLEEYLDDKVRKENPEHSFTYEEFARTNQNERWRFIERLHKDFDSIISHFFLSLAMVDIATKKEYYKKVLSDFSDIAYAMLLIDHHVEEKTTKEAEEYLQQHFVECYQQAFDHLTKGSAFSPKAIGETKVAPSKLLVDVFDDYHNLAVREKEVLVNYVDTPKYLENALVYIETTGGTGSGFIISPDGVCITCAHVVGEGKAPIYARLTLEDGEKEIHQCKLLYKSEENDFALIKLETVNQFYFETEDDFSKLELGHEIAIFGYPFGAGLNDNVMELMPTLTKGYISSRQVMGGNEYYFLDASARPGNSGGPVFDGVTGKVIGYLCGAYGDQTNKIVFMRSLKFYSSNVIKE